MAELSPHHYIQMFNRAWLTIRRIGQELIKYKGDYRTLEYTEYIEAHGYLAQPRDREIIRPLIPIGLGKPLSPATIENQVAIILCNDNDTLPGLPSTTLPAPQDVKKELTAWLAPTSKMLVVTNANLLSPLELSLILLHEIRHARHYIGREFHDLPSLDQDEDSHEALTWDYWFDVMDLVCGDSWLEAVKKEIDLIRPSYWRGAPPGQKRYVSSSFYQQDLDQLFGKTSHQSVLSNRITMTSVRANLVLAQEKKVNRIEALRNITDALYNK